MGLSRVKGRKSAKNSALFTGSPGLKPKKTAVELVQASKKNTLKIKASTAKKTLTKQKKIENAQIKEIKDQSSGTMSEDIEKDIVKDFDKDIEMNVDQEVGKEIMITSNTRNTRNMTIQG